jgi:hypothetical protein
LRSSNAQIAKALSLEPLSKALQTASRIVATTDEEEYKRWLRLELAGYFAGNSALSEDTVVPEYRTVTGQHFDLYGNRLQLESKLSFVNEMRLREGVEELESLASSRDMVTLHDAKLCELIHANLGVEVHCFRFDAVCLKGVLAAIRAEAEDRANILHSDALTKQTTTASEEIVQLRPNIYGVGLDLRALWRKLRSYCTGRGG